ncbi:prepronociceptin [Lacerta agilis]|uniref:prepronociceptin n=1 Tax=Lacerta agilis TaxID=80427 RepID=UPI0014193AF4|nr:prepronociceptin [Lacerta agilis]
MRVLLWNVLSFCLLAYALSDCRRDCLNCHRHLYSHQQDDFSLLICVMECEGKLLSSATWGLCSKATGGKAPSPLELGSLEDGASRPLEVWNGGLKRLGSLARASDLDKAGGEKGVSKTSSLFHQADVGDGDGVQALLRDLPAPFDIPKGVSGFLNGPFGYEPVGEAGVQELQKRFGGFIGVRKSARKWHNQKRFSEFLKQYLGMSPRSVEYDDLADDLKEQNEI